VALETRPDRPTQRASARLQVDGGCRDDRPADGDELVASCAVTDQRQSADVVFVALVLDGELHARVRGVDGGDELPEVGEHGALDDWRWKTVRSEHREQQRLHLGLGRSTIAA